MQMNELAKTTLTALACLALLAHAAPATDRAAATIGTPQLHTLVMDNAYALEAGRPAPHVIVDARPRKEYDASRVFSAVSIPVAHFSRSKALLPKDKGTPLVVYCGGSDQESCAAWREQAAAAGYANVTVYSEGFRAWKKKRMPTAP